MAGLKAIFLRIPQPILLCLVCVFGNVAQACMCAPLSPPCEAVWKSDAVFAGTVVRSDGFLASLSNVIGARDESWVVRSELRVAEAFQGVDIGSVIEVTTPYLSSACGFPFKEGETYLVYAQRRSGDRQFITTACTRTKLLEFATADLRYLRELRAGKALTRVFGFVTRDLQDIEGTTTRSASLPVSGIPISLTGSKGTWKTVTRADGSFSFMDLPPGDFRISADLGEERDLVPQREFVLERGSCSEQIFVAQPAGEISGRVLTLDEAPLRNHLVDIVAVPPTPAPANQSTMTNSDGEFVFRALEPGEYLIGVNLVVPPQSKRGPGSGPYPATYYPGVVQRDEAEILHLEKGQELAGVTVSLPPPLIGLKIRGQVTLDGKPVAGVSVALQQRDYNLYTDSTRSDSSGEFSLIGFEGYDYSLIATWVRGLTGYLGRAEVPSGSVQAIEIRLERRKQ